MKHRIGIFPKFIVMMTICSIFFSSCQKEEFTSTGNIESEEYLAEGNQMVLGKELENPYSVENMQKAYSNLMSNGRTSDDVEISTTHYYVRFLPSDSSEIATLEADTLLELFDHPLLFEIKQVGNWYHDPSIPDSLPTWQYTVVEKEYQFPKVRYEILADLFMVDEEDAGSSNGRVSSELWDDLEYEALRITNNLDEEEEGETNGRVAASRWRPSGRVRVIERIGTSIGSPLCGIAG